MIGVIGPADSVALVRSVAQDLKLEPFLIPRVYENMREAIGLARDIEALCSVILYTGRMPFLMAALSTGLGIRSEYIPHEGTDLYRAIASMLLLPGQRGRLPRASFDSMEASQVLEAFRELGIDPPQHIIPLQRDEAEEVLDALPIAEKHRDLFKSGAVDLCVTCIGEVYQHLSKLGVPTLRIVHSRIVIRESLIRAKLSMELSRAEAAQVAVCVLQIRDQRKHKGRKLSQRLLASVGKKYAVILDGRITKQGADKLVILATRGAVERSFHSDIINRASTMKTEMRHHLKLGFGFGATPSLAEENARRAMDEYDEVPRDVVISLGDKQATSIEFARPIDVREQRAQNLRTARRLNISPTLVKRLRMALRELDPSNFTANELASTYGVMPRSARRVISALRERGLVKESGLEKRDTAGRPQIAYSIALDRLNEMTGADTPA